MAGKAILVVSVIFWGIQSFKRKWRISAAIGAYVSQFYKFVKSWTDSLRKIENRRVDSIPKANNNEIGFTIEDEPVY